MKLQQQLKEAQKLLGEEIKNMQIAVCDVFITEFTIQELILSQSMEV